MEKRISMLLCVVIFFGLLYYLLTVKRYKAEHILYMKQANEYRSQANDTEAELKKLQVLYDAAINDKKVSYSRYTQILPFTAKNIGISNPFLATQSGILDEWTYKNTKQKEYEINLPPYNEFQLHLITYTTDSPVLNYQCSNSSIDSMYNICGAKPLVLSEYTYKGKTKQNFPYYQRLTSEGGSGKPMDETIIQLPDTDSGEHRLVRITLVKTTDPAVNKEYTQLINSLDVAQ